MGAALVSFFRWLIEITAPIVLKFAYEKVQEAMKRHDEKQQSREETAKDRDQLINAETPEERDAAEENLINHL